MNELQKLFVFVSADKTEAFKALITAGTVPAELAKKIVFLAGTGEIYAKNTVFGANTQAKLSALQGEIDALETLVGTIPADATASDIVGLIAEKVAAEAAIARAAEKANADAIKAISDDYLKAADKTELSGAISKEAEDRAAADSAIEAKIGGSYTSEATVDAAIKAAKAAADAAQGAADAAQGTADGAVDRLDVIEGEGEGSIKKAVADAKAAIEGTLGEQDAKTLEAINDRIDNVQGIAEAQAYSLKSVDASGETNVKEAYQLFKGDAAVAESAVIKIYKDSSLKSVALDGQNLKFTYILADGTESEVSVDVSAFLHESEFGDGLQVVDHVISVKKDASSEGFLTVGADGIKLAGVQYAIDAAKSGAEATAAGALASAKTELEGKISAAQTAAEGHADSLNSAMNTRVEALEAIDHDHENKTVLDGITAEKVAAWDGAQAGAEATAAAALSAAKATIDAYTVNGKAISTNPVLGAADINVEEGKTVAAAIAALEAAIGEGGDVAAQIQSAIAGLDAEITSADGSHVTVKVTEVDGKITAVNVTESDIASAQALTELSALVGTAADDSSKATAFGKAAAAKAAADAAQADVDDVISKLENYDPWQDYVG